VHGAARVLALRARILSNFARSATTCLLCGLNLSSLFLCDKNAFLLDCLIGFLIASLLMADSFAVDRRHWSADINLAPRHQWRRNRTVRPRCCAAVRPASASAPGGSHSSKCNAERSMTPGKDARTHWTHARGQPRCRRHAGTNGPRVNLFGACHNVLIRRRKRLRRRQRILRITTRSLAGSVLLRKSATSLAETGGALLPQPLRMNVTTSAIC
jgi:hypothetical protein